MRKHINRNYHRLTVHLVNLKGENKFQNTFTFNNVKDEGEARHIIRTMLTEGSETDQALARRIRKAYYHGKEFIFRTEKNDETPNGWIVK